MDNFVLFSTVMIILLLNTVQYTRCDDIYYIIPTPDSPCPGSIKGQPCFTLQQYAANPSQSSNVTLLLSPGTHRMDSQLSTSSINYFAMRAVKPASVTVLCSQNLQPGAYFWFSFTGLQTVSVSDIAFNGCKVYLASSGNNKLNATFVRSLFVNTTYTCCSTKGVLYIGPLTSVVVKQCVFSDSNGETAIISSNGYNLTVDQSIFKNNYIAGFPYGGVAIYHTNGYINILNSNFINNTLAKATNFQGGAVYISAGIAIIAYSYFTANVAGGNGGAIVGLSDQIAIINSSFTNNTVGSPNSHGGAVYAGSVNITNSYFTDNGAGSLSGNGGAVYITGGNVNVANSYFSHNVAGGRGGAIALDQAGNITLIKTTFTNNTASVGGGGAIYSGGRYANISLLYSIFSNNAGASCGVLDVDEFYHSSVNVIGNTFIYNRAAGTLAGSNGGGVICVRNASVSVLGNEFSHNVAAGDAGVLQVDESDITIKNSIFNKNTAGSNGGVLYTYFYPTSYTITNSTFTNNQAGGDGGVMFVGRAGSQVKITSLSTFSYNSAKGRGGVIAIAGSTLYVNGSYLCKKNSAKLGRVVSACNSKVVISNPELPSTPDPVYPICTLYGCPNTTYT